MSRTTDAVGEDDDGCCYLAQRNSEENHFIGLLLLAIFFSFWLASRTIIAVDEQDDYCWWGCAAAGATRTAAVDSLVRSSRLGFLLFQLCAVSGRRTTHPRAAANAATPGGASRVPLATRSNRAPASSGGCTTTGRAFAGHGQGNGPT